MWTAIADDVQRVDFEEQILASDWCKEQNGKGTITDYYETKNGIVVTPGRFEGEPIYTPFYYMLSRQGGDFEFEILEEDKKCFPEIPPLGTTATLNYREDGFVHCEIR